VAQPAAELQVAHLVERDAELAAAVSALDSARSGAGSLLLIEGPAGIGKTALADAARGRAARDAMRVLHARATELEQAFPFGVVQQCLAPVVRRAEDRERLLQGAAALAEPALLAVPEGAPGPPAALLHGLFWLVSNVADEAPLAIVVDDVQWADEPSQLFLAYLARRVESLPVALIAGVRTEDDVSPGRGVTELRAIARGARLEPRPLGLQGVEQVLGEAGAGPVDREFAAACRAATGGNPFLLGELVKALLSDGVPFTAGAVGRVQSVAPATIAEAVTATLDRLGAAPTALARAAAVIGDGTALELAGELAGLKPEPAASSAAALVQAGLLDDARELRFRHPILGAAIAARVPTRERDAAHQHAAELLRARGAGPERIALQLIHTPPAGDARVVAELRRAAAHATASGAPETAAALLQRALAEPPEALLRGEVLVQLALAELGRGRLTEGGDHMQEAYRCAPDARTRALAVSIMGSFRVDPRDRDRIVSMATQVLPELGPEDRDLALKQSVDLQIAARDEQAIRDGDYLAVVGDSHPGANPLCQGLFAHRHPAPERFRALYRREVGAAQPFLLPPWGAGMNAEARGVPVLGDDAIHIAMSPESAAPNGHRTWQPHELWVESSGDLVDASGELRVPLADVFSTPIFVSGVRSWDPLPGGEHSSRIVVDKAVLRRESWSASGSHVPAGADHLAAWARDRGMPRRVFVKTPLERKPFYLDVDSPVLCGIAARHIRQAAEAREPVRFTEMLPGPEDCWLADPEGRRYTSELRLVAFDSTHNP
jgi:hypothetical protein